MSSLLNPLSANSYSVALDASYTGWTPWKVILSAWRHYNALMNNYRFWKTNCVFFISNNIRAACLCSRVNLAEWEGCLCQLLLSHTEPAFQLCSESLMRRLSGSAEGRTVQEEIFKTQEYLGLCLQMSFEFSRMNKLKPPGVVTSVLGNQYFLGVKFGWEGRQEKRQGFLRNLRCYFWCIKPSDELIGSSDWFWLIKEQQRSHKAPFNQASSSCRHSKNILKGDISLITSMSVCGRGGGGCTVLWKSILPTNIQMIPETSGKIFCGPMRFDSRFIWKKTEFHKNI